MRIVSIACALLLLAGCSSRPQKPAEVRHAKVELLEDGELRPGAQVWLGVRFTMDPGWHIYWQNPGDSGQPPVITWKLPPGWSAAAIEWPKPERLNSQGASIMDYGYKDDVLLMAPLQVTEVPPANARAEAEVKYLICREVCLPEKAQLQMDAGKPAQNAALFAKARYQLPQPWPREWKATAVSKKDNFVVTINTGSRIDHADFFPLDPEQIENAASQQLQANARGATITLKKSDQLLKPISVLRGVIEFGDGKAYRVDIPVTQK
jgi:DsbC/DsbD-like thiol-disulfide interchange protein